MLKYLDKDVFLLRVNCTVHVDCAKKKLLVNKSKNMSFSLSLTGHNGCKEMNNYPFCPAGMALTLRHASITVVPGSSSSS